MCNITYSTEDIGKGAKKDGHCNIHLNFANYCLQ